MKIKSISKQALAVLLSLSVLASTLMLNTFSVFAEGENTTPETTPIQYWGGTAATGFAGGTGTSTDPFLISTGEQLAYLTTTCDYNGTNGKYYKLTNDIYLNDVTDPEWYANGTPNPWLFQTDENKAFSGTLDGDGHTIYGLYINGAYSKAGLFVAVGNTVIKNLKISKSYVSNTKDNNYAGVAALAGFRGAWGTLTISNCAIDDDVQIIGKSGCVGGFIGYIPRTAGITTIENCYSGAKLTQTATWFAADCLVREFVGGRKDQASANLTIKNSYTTGSHELATSNDTTKPTFENCYTTNAASTEANVKILTKAQMTGAKARVYMNALDFKNVWYTEAGKTPQLRALVETVPTEDTKLWKVWDGTLATIPEGATHPYDGGNGTEAEPYLISTPEQFAYMLITANGDTTNSISGGAHYKLLDDIYLNDVEGYENWGTTAPTNPWRGLADNDDECSNRMFYGHIHGNGKTVYGLYYNGGAYYSGLIYRFGTGASVEDLRISKAYVKSTSWNGSHGVLVGHSWANTTVKNVVIDETVEFTTGGYGGAVIGGIASGITQPVTIENCYVAAKLAVSSTRPVTAFFGTPYSDTGNKFDYTTSSHLIIKNSYYVGDKVLANTDETYPVKYVNCYTTKVYDTENGETAPTGVTAGSNLEAMKVAGLTAVLKVFPKLGNVNGDANADVDICDLVILKKFDLGMGVNIDIYSSDVNNDREINDVDFTVLKRYILDDASVFQ